ncbi:MAG: 4Fe-4S dicluster domain-containing protein [Euryarchaeota archaeon]|nr:4Fe-4S dicluster domain-containing protein [Euryarchaeota archaeon]
MRKVSFAPEICVTCGTCSIACAVVHSMSGDPTGAALEVPVPRARVHIAEKGGKLKLVRCRNCRKAKCIAACPEKAIKKNAQDYVLIDERLCNGCWKCIEACPFQAIVKSDDEKVAQKCDSCLDRPVPACVESCNVKALKVEEVEMEEEG